jgi:hypothetical protein
MESREISTSGGKVTGTRTFHVWDDASPIEEPDQIYLGVGGLPAVGELFPGSKTLYATSYTMTHLADSSRTWRVVFNYESADPTGISAPSEPGYLQISFEYQGIPRELYRTWPGLDLQGGTPDDRDIGGKPIDSGGYATSFIVDQHLLVIEETVSASSLFERSPNIRNAVATRNQSAFLGVAPGGLLYEGCSGRRIGVGLYSLTHRFSYDPFYHMIQVPRRNSSGKVDLETTAQRGSYAGWVRFIQPFPLLSEFSLISGNF